MHHSICGILYDNMFKIIAADSNGRDYIGEVNIKMGPSEKHIIKGQFHMIEIGTYDYLVYSLLADLFGVYSPIVLTINHNAKQYFVTKRIPARKLLQSDYYPKTDENASVRFQLCLIIYLCRLIGCDFHMGCVEILDRVLMYRNGYCIGRKKPMTVDQELFYYLFEVIPTSAKKMFVENPNLKETDSDMFKECMKNVEYKLFTHTMAYRVINHFRNIDFDTDILRQYVYLRDEPIRSSVRNRMKLKLSKSGTAICTLIQYNYTILAGYFPLGLFPY